jgi:hypothetical protein
MLRMLHLYHTPTSTTFERAKWGTSGGEESPMAKGKQQKESSLEQQQPYDNALKSILEGQEAVILPHFLPGAVYQETYTIETVRAILRTDRVYEIIYKGQAHILHLEFQTSSDTKMAARLLDYHAYLYYKYALPVISIIIYPFRTAVARSPLEEISDGEIILSFRFRVFPLWKLSARQYMDDHVIAMYALLPAMSGANGPLLDQAISEMVEYYQDDEITLARDLRWMGIILRRTDRVTEEDKRMIQERLSMYDDLMENDPEMRRLREKYQTEGEAKGEIKASREMILTVVKMRFPSLTKQAQQRVTQVANVDVLRKLFEQLMSASDEKTVSALFTVDSLN